MAVMGYVTENAGTKSKASSKKGGEKQAATTHPTKEALGQLQQVCIKHALTLRSE
jgi:hypothetical protein